MPHRPIYSVLIAGVALVSLSASAEGPEPAGEQTCTEVRAVHDGDTFTCVTGTGPLRVRVAGIDAPEVGQGFWRVSRDQLRSSTPAGSRVDCYKVDRYERQICRVHTPEGNDVALGLVEAGLAWHTVKYREEQSALEQAEYSAAEASARKAREGLWALREPLTPWDCREAKKNGLRCN